MIHYIQQRNVYVQWGCSLESYSIKTASPTLMRWRWKIFHIQKGLEEHQQMMLKWEADNIRLEKRKLFDTIRCGECNTNKENKDSLLLTRHAWVIYIKYLWGTEEAKQKEGTALSQASRVEHVREKSVSLTWENIEINESVKEQNEV